MISLAGACLTNWDRQLRATVSLPARWHSAIVRVGHDVVIGDRLQRVIRDRLDRFPTLDNVH
jgi:hypothetical protein